MKKTYTLILLCWIATSTFNSIYAQSTLSRSFKRIKKSDTLKSSEAAKYVSVDLFKIGEATPFKETTKPKEKNWFELSEKGQKEYIKAMNSQIKAHNPKALRENLGHNLAPKKPSSSDDSRHKEYTTFLKKIEIDVNDELKGTKEVGRIDQLVIRLSIPADAPVTFKSLQNISTKYGFREFGKLGISNTTSFVVNGGVDLGGTGSTSSTQNSSTNQGGDEVNNSSDSSEDSNSSGSTNTSNLGLSFTKNRTVTEEINIRPRFIAMKVSVSPTEILIYQEGSPENNLNDKILLDIVLETKPDSNSTSLMLDISGLYDKKRKAVINDTLHKVKPYYRTEPKTNSPENDFSIKIKYNFIYRKVTNRRGKRTIGYDGDDAVKFLRYKPSNKITQSIVFCKKGELTYDRWTIRDTSAAGGNSLGLDYYGEPVQLKFMSLDEATRFLTWLKITQRTYIGSNKFKLCLKNDLTGKCNPLNAYDISKLKIY